LLEQLIYLIGKGGAWGRRDRQPKENETSDAHAAREKCRTLYGSRRPFHGSTIGLDETSAMGGGLNR
jgi:hypothetical protein